MLTYQLGEKGVSWTNDGMRGEFEAAVSFIRAKVHTEAGTDGLKSGCI